MLLLALVVHLFASLSAPLQAGVAFAPAVHAFPQEPQLAGSVAGYDSQPSGFCASQSKYDGSHWSTTHVPPAHSEVAFGSSHDDDASPSSTVPLQSLSSPSHTSGGE